jgi:hypothetical protein
MKGSVIMTYEEMLEMMKGYEEDCRYLDSELDYVAGKPTYGDFGLAVKESYLEYAQENAYDE